MRNSSAYDSHYRFLIISCALNDNSCDGKSGEKLKPTSDLMQKWPTSLLQVYGLIVSVVIELSGPYFVRTLVIALTEADGCSKTDVKIA